MSLSVLTLSGCGLFHADKSYLKAKQEAPLEIPAGMDRPAVNDALTIPNVNAKPNDTISQTLSVPGDVASTYKAAAQAVDASGVGAVVAHDDAAHAFTVNVGEPPAKDSKPGFFSRMFGGGHKTKTEAPDLSSPTSAGAVQVAVTADGGASTVTVTGLSANVAKVAAAIKSKLGS
ncbi:outer membrane protein assembly factor BamC [Oleiagrimonas sp. C23AA]|uniref:outer membrane protein assembly factor BamC n=1 Tax=Oleiagrimonas sp. C23AA TaxID=2719047 RepID=UPI00142210BA|nr:outer membrane protein assembly factor BamC [Oleiagrimonas sp. C23AA]NII11820.1 outer membrane protein assembly factor BamC [Oleiagrimonas sp. C23AA]